MPLIDHFGIIAPYYDRAIPFNRAEKLITIINLPVKGPLLDAGGGTGRVSKVFRGLAAPVVVADLSLEMLSQAKGADDLCVSCSHSERLPFPEEYFDRVIMIDAFHHVCNQRETAGELWRVLKPGGRIVIEEPDIRSFTVKLVALAEKLALMRSHFISPPMIGSMFNHRNAEIRMEYESYNAWIIVDKR
jgi:demethylmenaquinone methyltransferase/2-methoxy-6-polyprenyl-1,4-benzoquinol methylase